MLMQINLAPTLSGKDFIFFYKKKTAQKLWGGGQGKKAVNTNIQFAQS